MATGFRRRDGFTLVEMLVIAPIVILTIGSFIALIVTLTGEVLSSRGSNTLAYNVQDALNRIESDIKLSTTFLATSTVPFTAANPQGYGANGSTTAFKNVGLNNNPILILNGIVTTEDPLRLSSRTVYLANQPHACSEGVEVYARNRPMTMNIIYFVDSSGTLWRRTVMPENYANTADTVRCPGASTTWQQPSCALGYTSSFCRTNDVKLTDGVGSDGLAIQYFAAAGSSAPITTAANVAASDADRGTALQSATTAGITLTARKTIAGRDIARTASLKVTRLDTNATSIAVPAAPTAVPSIPVVASTISEGHHVTFTWPSVSTATGYDLNYRINGGAWQTGLTNVGTNTRTYTVEAGTHKDTVEAQVRARNSVGTSTFGARSTAIPLWAPLAMENGWGDYATPNNPYAPPSYTKTSAGVVMLRGLAASGTASTIGRLPVDYRPARSLMFAASSASSPTTQAIGRLDIHAGGEVNMAVGTNGWFALDSIAFMPGAAAFTTITPLSSGWLNFGVANPNWALTGYMTDSLGRVHMRGVINGGTMADGTTLFTLGAAVSSLRPGEYTHWLQLNSNSNGGIGYNPGNTSIVMKAGNNGYMGMNVIYFPGAARADGTNCLTQWCTLPLVNGWAHHSAGFSTPRYTKAADGMVHLKGLIRSGTSADMTGDIPAAYCPKTMLIMPIMTGGVWGRINVVPKADGTCYLSGSSYTTGWVSLDSIRYMAE